MMNLCCVYGAEFKEQASFHYILDNHACGLELFDLIYSFANLQANGVMV